MHNVEEGLKMHACRGERERQVSFKTYDEYGYAFDEGNPNFHLEPEYNMAFVRATVEYLHQRLAVKGRLFLNEVLENLGFDRRPEGQVIGWKSVDGPLDVTFENVELVDKPGFHRVWVTLKPQGVIINDIQPRL
jgi:hypothetical protein